MGTPILMAWSGGKDSAMTLRKLLSGKRPVAALLTTITSTYDRVSMHGVRRALLEAQAASLGLPLDIVTIVPSATNEDYGRAMKAAMDRWRERGVRTVAFGDLHLRDVRSYREENLRGAGMKAVFPLWGKSPSMLARRFIKDGFKAVVTCVDTTMLDASFSGRELDARFLEDLPRDTDPCGEKGEFHTFVYDGPNFKSPVPFIRGERVLRDGRFMFTDLELV